MSDSTALAAEITVLGGDVRQELRAWRPTLGSDVLLQIELALGEFAVVKRLS
jgi:hypothetical protein